VVEQVYETSEGSHIHKHHIEGGNMFAHVAPVRSVGSRRSGLRFAAAWLAAMIGGAGASSAYADATDFAVFGRDSTTFQGFATVIGAPSGSNGNVSHVGGSAQFTALYGGGSFLSDSPNSTARPNVTGDVIFNGDVIINELADVGGSVHAGGNLDYQGGGFHTVGGDLVAKGFVKVGSSNTIFGNIMAGSNVDIGSSSTVKKDVGSNANVSLGIAAKVDGHVTHAGSLTLASFASVGSDSVGTVTPNPAKYTPTNLPAATGFTSGGQNVSLAVFEQKTLTPGSYGNLIFNGSNTLNLSAGTYGFDSISSPGSFLTLNLDVSGGSINIFVTGDVDFKSIAPKVNGQDFAAAPAALASNVLLESHGNITLQGQFFGALFTPNGDITTATIGAVKGQLIGQDVSVGSSTDITFARNTYLASVPEPSALAMILVSGGALLVRRRR
jgi:hypothetical protein